MSNRQVTIHRVKGQFHVAKVREGGAVENFQKGALIETGVLFDDVKALYEREGFTTVGAPQDRPGPQTIVFYEPKSGVLARLKGEAGSAGLSADDLPPTIKSL